ncbi:peptidase, partial [Enterococcus faecium]|nr:peptidase [Enterococcus faecium]
MKKIALLTLFSTALLVSAPLVSFADEATGSSGVSVLADDVVDPVEPTDPTTPVD